MVQVYSQTTLFGVSAHCDKNSVAWTKTNSGNYYQFLEFNRTLWESDDDRFKPTLGTIIYYISDLHVLHDEFCGYLIMIFCGR